MDKLKDAAITELIKQGTVTEGDRARLLKTAYGKAVKLIDGTTVTMYGRAATTR